MSKRIIILMFIFISGLVSLICIDILNIEKIYSNIENISNIVSNEISKNGGITNSIRQYIKKEIKGEIYCALDDCSSVKSGDTYVYIVSKEIDPIIISYKSILIKVSKSVVIK